MKTNHIDMTIDKSVIVEVSEVDEEEKTEKLDSANTSQLMNSSKGDPKEQRLQSLKNEISQTQ